MDSDIYSQIKRGNLNYIHGSFKAIKEFCEFTQVPYKMENGKVTIWYNRDYVLKGTYED